MSERLYTTRQAAAAVQISRVTLQNWIALKKFVPPAMQKFGKVRLWTPADVARLRETKKEIYQEKRKK